MTDDRGQALILAVLALALAAVTIAGLAAAQDRIFADARERRAGEAAVEAAGAALADALIEFRGPLPAFVTDPIVIEQARSAAEALSAANGGGRVRELVVSASPGNVEVALSIGAHLQRASIGTTCCRR